MRLWKTKIYVDAVKMSVLIIVAMFACSRTAGAFTFVIAGAGIFYALANKIGPAICCYVFLPLCAVTNPVLIPKFGSMWKYGLRLGPLAIGICLVLGASRRVGTNCLPFGGILPFLLCAIISSMVGYVPQISYLKLINYFVFLLGIWLGTRNIQHKPQDLQMIRAFFLGMIFIVVWGSLLLIPFPAISYSTSLVLVMMNEGMEAANAAGKEMLASGGQSLFCGITLHSQSLSPILALSMGWLLCDMLFVEKRIRLPHAVTIVAMLPMLYMTRSRVALLTGASAMTLISFYTVNRIQVARQVKNNLRKGVLAFFVLAVAMAAVAEVRDQSITKWIRKTNDIEADQREMAEAFTGSRQGAMEQSLSDYRRNPTWGSGFQVIWEHRDLWQRSNGLVLSASIEKGVLPVMILGECGIVGCITFGIFLISFYATCARRRLHVTSTMFTLLLVSNMGEASFFSPGGIGGVLWMLTVLGGFVIDTVLLYERNMANDNRFARFR